MLCCKRKKIPTFHSKRIYGNSSSIFDVLIDERKAATHRKKSKIKDSTHFHTGKEITNIEKTIFGSPIANQENFEEIENPEKKKTFKFYLHKKSYHYTKNSCNFFTPESKIRYFCLWLKSHTIANYLSLLVILVHSVMLGFYDYKDPNNPNSINPTLHILEPIFLTIYSLEMLVKIIAQGFYTEPNTYLRDVYNIIDFIVVITAIFSYNPQLQHLGVLRLFRLLSFLENLTYLKSMKLLMKSLQKSLVHLLVILSFLGFTLLVFSIFSLNCWRDNDFSQQDILKNIENYTKYDNIQDSYLTNFEVYMKDKWPYKFYTLTIQNNAFASAVYFIMLLVVCSYFISNMFLAAVLSTFVKIIKDLPDQKKKKFKGTSPKNNEGIKKSGEFVLMILIYCCLI